MQQPHVAITMGDPSGIGPEVVAKALVDGEITALVRPLVVGNARLLQHWFDRLDTTLRAAAVEAPPADAIPGIIPVLDADGYQDFVFPVGVVSVDSARAAHAWIERSARLCIDGAVDAMSTAPVNKDSFQQAGITDTGHQEILQRLSGADYVATMLVSRHLRCMHLSTHKPLAEACAFVTRANVLRAIELTQDHFVRWGFPNPRIAVAALNPHASDNGLIGHEEQTEIAPAVADARARGIEATGPHPADSVFNHAIDGRYDVVLVMYHDQGHIAIKVFGFEESITVNLGLPFIRTSVDHGTAFDIAGKGIADHTSMVEAVKLAHALTTGSLLKATAVS